MEVANAKRQGQTRSLRFGGGNGYGHGFMTRESLCSLFVVRQAKGEGARRMLSLHVPSNSESTKLGGAL
jgi:hypothetical protein